MGKANRYFPAEPLKFDRKCDGNVEFTPDVLDFCAETQELLGNSGGPTPHKGGAKLVKVAAPLRIAHLMAAFFFLIFVLKIQIL